MCHSLMIYHKVSGVMGDFYYFYFPLFFCQIVVLNCISHCLIGVRYWYDSMSDAYSDTNIAWMIVNTLFILNHSSNLYFYIVSGRQFRSEFKQMICCKICKKKKPMLPDVIRGGHSSTSINTNEHPM